VIRVELLTQKQGSHFDLPMVEKLRSKDSRSCYVHFVDRFVPAAIGYRKWKENRLLLPLSEYFSISDEAFMLLCYDCYNTKWMDEYKTKNKLYNDTNKRPQHVVSQQINSMHVKQEK
jgi:hypothetical protein